MRNFELVTDGDSDYKNTDWMKNCFLRRDFRGVYDELEQKNEAYMNSDAMGINRALVCHILGEYEKALGLYGNYLDNNICRINFFAFCHRYFNYRRADKLVKMESGSHYGLAYDNNYYNFLIGTNGIEIVKEIKTPYSIYLEQIINDLYIRIGKDALHRQADLLKDKYCKSVDINDKKKVNHIKKKVGIFATDVQRHKDAAIIYELVECFKEKFEVIVYFNNIFANKLITGLEKECKVRYVVKMYYEEINNMFFDDEIDILIDLAEYGLRNNNIALGLVQNCMPMSELLLKFPLLLQTNEYYSGERANYINECTCIIGDMRCLTDEEITQIDNEIEGKIIFESHAFDEPLFKQNFQDRIARLGMDVSRYTSLEGVLPFKKYLEFISACKTIVVSSGASYVELAEAINYGNSVKLMSENKLLVQAYDLYYSAHEDLQTRFERVHNINNIHRERLCQYVDASSEHELLAVANKMTRIAYFEDGVELCINNTCNGDIVILCED